MARDTERVTVVGAGMAGAACVSALRRGGVDVSWLDRGPAAGGRMASPMVRGRRVDIGASYFTVRDDGFAAVVDEWAAAGIARPWTDTFAVFAPGEAPTTAPGPLRWSAAGGLASLVQAAAGGVEPELGRAVETLPAGHVVLAMPDPEAARLIEVPDAVACDPAIAVVCGYEERCWPFEDGAFVNGHAAIEFVADDGARRGDDAPVLVVHTTAGLARRHPDERHPDERHPDDPSPAVEEVAGALSDLLGLPRPAWTSAYRWSLAKPAGGHPDTHRLVTYPLVDPVGDDPVGDDPVRDDSAGGRLVGLAGDQWCGTGPPRVESAWRSGTDLAGALLSRLG